MPTVAELFPALEFGPAPESDVAARAWLAAHQDGLRHYIGGEWVAPREGTWFESVNPANRAPLARVAQGSAADVDAAVRAGRDAFPAWAALAPHARSRHLYALARTVHNNYIFLAVL